jgi:hypothetical protein
MSDPSQIRGWTISEAIRRTASHARLAERVAAHKAWRSGGYATPFTLESECVPAREARHYNSAECEQRRLYNTAIATQNALFDDVRELLLGTRLLAWGRRESPLAAPQPIPPGGWKLLKFPNPRASKVQEITGQSVEVFDVRIFPVLEAPNALEYLSGLTLTETFQQFVFGDPQWELLRQRAKEKGNDVLEPGHRRGLYSALWPADCGQDNWPRILFWLARRGPIGHRANLLVGQRFARLVNYLRTGRLLAEGTIADGKTVSVPRSLWFREQTHIDVRSGDLVEYRPDARERSESYSAPIFMGITLRNSEEAFHGKHIERDELLQSATEEASGIASAETAFVSLPIARRPQSRRRRPVAEDVAQALKQAGLARDPGPRTWKQIASLIEPHLSRKPRNVQEWNALATAVKRHFKNMSPDLAEASEPVPTK